MFKGLSIPVSISRFFANMKDEEYVEAHLPYRVTWGIILFLKELVKWSIIIFIIHLLNAELSSFLMK